MIKFEKSHIKLKSWCFKMFLFWSVFLLIFAKGQESSFLLIDVQTHQKKVVKDSLSAVHFLDSLAQNSYFFTQVKEVKKKDTITEILFDKGLNYNKIKVHFSDEIQRDLNLKSTGTIQKLDSTKRKINDFYTQKGFAFNRIKTKFIGIENGIPKVKISVEKLGQRKIDKIVFKGYDRLPKRFVKNLQKEFVGKTYQSKNIENLNRNLQNHPFVFLEKVPQTLFRKDSTQVFLFLKKRKVNSFDGVIGFGNDENDKIAFNGTLNVKFKNLFNGFESINLYWQRQVDKGQTFNLEADVPYLFGSNLGTKNTLHIYRQDTIFANVKFSPELYYHLNNRQKIGVQGMFETSTVLDETYTQADDFTKNGVGITYQFEESSNVNLFLHKTLVNASVGFVQTNYDVKNTKNTQRNYYLLVEKNVPIYKNHYLNLKGEGSWIDAKNTLSYNEKLRFGGWNSMRGFNENSLLADYFFYGNAEYRYLINDSAFFDTFVQYGQLHNDILTKNLQLYSFGLGFHFHLPIGLMSLQISNGNEFSQSFDFRQTKIHWGILSRF